MAYYRYINNIKITEKDLISRLSRECAKRVKGEPLLVLMDTTEINLSWRNNRIRTKVGLGYLSDNKSQGFLLHPGYCINANTYEPIGIAGIRIITREKAGGLEKKEHREITNKESDKWFSTAIELRDGPLKDAADITFIFDREGDIYEVLNTVGNEKTNLVIRGCHNRRIKSDCEGVETIKDALNAQESRQLIRFHNRLKNGKTEQVEAYIKYTNVTLLKPKKHKKYIKGIKKEIEVNVVQVEQIGTCSTGEKVSWFILTTQEVNSFEQAKDIVKKYKARWKIEELFRLMKTEGFNIEDSELEQASSIRKLSILVMEAALNVEKLKQARDGTSDQKITEVFDEEEVEFLEILNNHLEGATVKQKNPHKKDNLGWGTWIIARLGGWKGYASQRPAGPITLFRGLQQFKASLEIYKLTKSKYV